MSRPTAEHVVHGLRAHFPSDRFVLLEQVHTASGDDMEGAQIADVIAVPLWASGRDQLHAIEIKVSRQDAASEIRHPAKNARFRDLCPLFSYAVPSPWKDLFPSETMVPAGCGLLSVGAGGVGEILRPQRRGGSERLSDFALSLFRAAARALERRAALPASPEHVQQLVEILGRGRVRLACDHAPRVELFKTPPKEVLCPHCAAGLPPDRLALERRIDEATPETLLALRPRLEERLGPDPDAALRALQGLEPDEVRELLRRAGHGELLDGALLEEDLAPVPAGIDVCAVRHARLVDARAPRHNPLAVPCDGCGAAVGERCRVEEEGAPPGPGLVSGRATVRADVAPLTAGVRHG